MSRNVKWNKKLAFDWPGQQQALQNLGELAADLLEARVAGQGTDATGKALPRLAGKGWYITEANDPRPIGRDAEAEHRNLPGSTGRPTRKIDRRGYARAKAAHGGKAWKGSSYTGAMWRSLTIRQKGKAGKLALNLYFAGSQRVGAGRVRNRDKARLLQYADRASGQGFEPAGRREFELMAFSRAEKQQLAAFWMRQCRIFKPR